MKWKKVWQNFYFYIYASFDRKIVIEHVTLKFMGKGQNVENQNVRKSKKNIESPKRTLKVQKN